MTIKTREAPYTLTEMAMILGEKRSRVESWYHSGLFTFTASTSIGAGSKHEGSEDDLIAAKLVKHLLEHTRLKRDHVGAIVGHFQRYGVKVLQGEGLLYVGIKKGEKPITRYAFGQQTPISSVFKDTGFDFDYCLSLKYGANFKANRIVIYFLP